MAEEEYPMHEYRDWVITAIVSREAYANGYKQGQHDRWISVEDRLPEDGLWVLTFGASITDDFQWDIGYLDVSGKWKCLGWDYPVTHWMPVPLPPNPEQR